MSPTILFLIILAGGIAILPLSKPAKGISKVLLVVLSVVMIALSAFGLFTAFLP